jgi:putative ABC transport system permease protein
MTATLRTAWNRIAGMFRRQAMDARLAEELDSHLELLAERFEENGMDPVAARAAARRELGGIAAMQEEFREQSGVPFADTVLYDLRLTVRSLFRDRFAFAVCVLSLGLAVGVGTAIFSAYEAAVLRSLPFPESEDLVLVSDISKAGRHFASLPNINDWRERGGVFSGLSAIGGQTMALSGNGRAERIRGGFVSHDFFQTLKAEPAKGHLHLQSKSRQAVISHRLWMSFFQGRQEIIGSGLTLNGEAYSVLGVLRPDFVFVTDDTDVWVPVENFATSQALSRNLRSFLVLGRLRPGSGIEAAGAAMRAMAADQARMYPESNAGHSAAVIRWREYLAEGVRGTLQYLLVAVSLLLLVACANVGGVLAARAAARRREFALQASLGAPRYRIARQILIEGVCIGAAGAIAGLVAAAWGTSLLPILLPDGASAAGPPSINGPVLGFCIVVSLLAGLLAGILPALGLGRPELNAALRDGDHQATSGKAGRIREAFLVVQVATSTILLLGGAALLTELRGLLNVNLGITHAESLLTMEYRVNRAKFASREQQWQFHRQVVEDVKTIPGVRNAALARAVPYSGNGGSIEFRLPTDPPDSPGAQAVLNTVTSDYFATMGISLLKGRACGDQDADNRPTVVMVNDFLAKRLWPNDDAIGKVMIFKDWATATVAGVVGGNRQNDIRRDPPEQVYACYSQNPGTLAAIVMRIEGDTKSIAEAAKRAVWRIDGDQAVWKIRTMQSLIDMQTREQRTVSALVSVFALFAGCLALFGVYGIARYDAARRLKELGIRRALGASSAEIFLRSVGRTLLLVTGGVAVGGALGPALIRKFASAPLEVILIALCCAAFLTAGVVAAARPGLLVLRTNPVDVLRCE